MIFSVLTTKFFMRAPSTLPPSEDGAQQRKRFPPRVDRRPLRKRLGGATHFDGSEVGAL